MVRFQKWETAKQVRQMSAIKKANTPFTIEAKPMGEVSARAARILPMNTAPTAIIINHSAAPSRAPREKTLAAVSVLRSRNHVDSIHPSNRTSIIGNVPPMESGLIVNSVHITDSRQPEKKPSTKPTRIRITPSELRKDRVASQ